MEIRFFVGIDNADAANERYRALAMQWHPDRCPDEDAHDVMAAINTEYAACMAGLAAGAWPPPPKANVAEAKPKKPAKPKPKPKPKAKPKTAPKTPVVPEEDSQRIISAAEALGRDIASTAVGVAFGILRRKMDI